MCVLSIKCFCAVASLFLNNLNLFKTLENLPDLNWKQDDLLSRNISLFSLEISNFHPELSM